MFCHRADIKNSEIKRISNEKWRWCICAWIRWSQIFYVCECTWTLKIHLRDYVLLSHWILAFFDGARNLKLISFFIDKLKGKKETSCDEYLTDYARKYFEVIFFVIDHAFFKLAYSLCNCQIYWNLSHIFYFRILECSLY